MFTQWFRCTVNYFIIVSQNKLMSHSSEWRMKMQTCIANQFPIWLTFLPISDLPFLYQRNHFFEKKKFVGVINFYKRQRCRFSIPDEKTNNFWQNYFLEIFSNIKSYNATPAWSLRVVQSSYHWSTLLTCSIVQTCLWRKLIFKTISAKSSWTFYSNTELTNCTFHNNSELTKQSSNIKHQTYPYF